ncbi:MAG TPA: 16S rRNA (uracil(1498)-N(3))-methyltransferase [Vicinamibacterales bacterium]|nr:16S rRNA (uracil(1498)-N(3))-methyltransferase [Vicinamibacterales bacterium]
MIGIVAGIIGVVNARFYVPDATSAGDLATLPHDEAQHLTRVLRLKTGDSVRVFNGRGGEFNATVESAVKEDVRVRVGSVLETAVEARVAVTLAQAVLKGDKMDDVVRDAVMMGVVAIQPIVTARSEVSLAALERGRRRDRWERIAISSAKQCGRAVVPMILEPRPLESFEGAVPAPVLMLVEPGAASGATALGDLDLPVPDAATVIVGPEGGWTLEELDAVSRFGRLITLGGRTLRADAMAVIALAALFAKWREF